MRADAETGGAEGGEKVPARRVFGRIRGKQPLRGAARPARGACQTRERSRLRHLFERDARRHGGESTALALRAS